MFRALMVDKVDGEFSSALVDLTDDDLPDGDVVVDIEYSTVNYKDGLAVTDTSPIVTSWPMVPGIDLAGTVSASTNSEVAVGERIVINGWGLGEGTWGGFGLAFSSGDKSMVVANHFRYL